MSHMLIAVLVEGFQFNFALGRNCCGPTGIGLTHPRKISTWGLPSKTKVWRTGAGIPVTKAMSTGAGI